MERAMPHDNISPEFSTPADEIFNPSEENTGDVRSAFKAVSDAILKPVKRVGTKAVLAAMIVAAAVMCAPHEAKAATVTATLTGVMGSGTDVTNVFGLGVNANLAGQPYILTYTFDDTKGIEAVYSNGGPPYGSSVTSTDPHDPNPSYPGTAVLQIGNGSWTFANVHNVVTGNVYTNSSQAIRYIPSGFISPYIGFNVQDTYGAGGNVGGADSVRLYGCATTGSPPLTLDPSWEASFTRSSQITIGCGFWNDFSIGYTDPTTHILYSASGSLGTIANINVVGAPAFNALAKSLGSPSDVPCGCNVPVSVNDPNAADKSANAVADPITVATGNMFLSAQDYATAGQNPLSFTRSYNSSQVTANPGTLATSLGTNWRSTYDRYLNIVSATTVTVERADGQVVAFTLSGSTWATDADVDMTLTQAGATWTLKDHIDNTETYTVTGSKGLLQSIAARNGYTQTLNYTGSQLTSVSDSYTGRSLGFTYYTSGLLETLTTPDGLVLTYSYTPATGGNQLTSVSYNTSPVTNITYQYTDASFPFALTGVVDEKGQQYQTWGYDAYGNANSSQRGSGADLTTLTYNADGTVTSTNAFGVADRYIFEPDHNSRKLIEISRAATSTTAAAIRYFGYDPNGYFNGSTDWNGNQTALVNNAQGNPTTITYAVGNSLQYSVTISYDPTFTHLPHQIIAPGLTSTFVYDASGNPKNRTDLDTTTTTIPYSTNGQSRETQWTWSGTGELLTVQLPRTDVVAKTTFGYDGTGALTSIKDALTHLTQITAHTNGGLPQTVIDPNSVTTTLTYDGRLNLNTRIVDPTGSAFTTTWTYDAANELQSFQKPDGSKLTYGYDTAHRLTSVLDLLGNTTTFTLDALAGATLTNVTNASSTVTRTSSAVFDALDRLTSYIGGTGSSQTTTYAYDNMGNVKTITPPSPQGAVTRAYDALNRLSTETDPAPGGTLVWTYDSFNRVLSAKDGLGNTTSYVNDGFGDRIQTASPDSGTTVFTYDADRNVKTAALPGSITKNYTFDALDRTKVTTYTGDTTLTVTNTYDTASGHGDAIGRLAKSVDQVGTVNYTYDERGDITKEVRALTGITGNLTTSYTYDAAQREATITYPSATLVTYTHDAMGEVTKVTAKPPSGTVTNVATSITYEPFGPVKSLTFGNGLAGAYAYDLDYRNTTRKDSSTGVTIQNLTYGYYPNNSVQTITDAVNAANTQSMTYDTKDNLASAASGAGGYGSYSFTWDGNSNIQQQIANGTTTNFYMTAGTSRLVHFDTSGSSEIVASTPTGNINTLKVGTTTLETFNYNLANQLAGTSTASQMTSYAYDLLGRRLTKTGTATATTGYQYDINTGNLLEEKDSGGTARVDYVYLNSVPVGTVQVSPNKVYFVHTDRLGTPEAVTDSTKAVQWSATYQPFGFTSTGVSGIVQNLRLPGQEWDLEAGTNHNGFRDYATNLTRYVQTDPVGLAGGMNTYQYAKGNPFKWIDPSGLSADQMCYQQTLRCPANEPVGSPDWRKYWGGSLGQTAFHCGGNGYLENRDAQPGVPINECIYDKNTRQLISSTGPLAECAGTPDQYDENDQWDHTFHDSGGPSNHFWGPLWTSFTYRFQP
jgi:RHS repeat-associated protein